MVAAQDQEGALLGLTILAAGGVHARRVHRPSFVAQRADLNTGWMRIGEWLSTHPPLARRIVALDPRFSVRDGARAGTARALGIMAAISAVTVVISVAGISRLPALMQRVQAGAEAAEQPRTSEAQAEQPYIAPALDIAIAQWNTAVERLSSFITAELNQGRSIQAIIVSWTHCGRPRVRWNGCRSIRSTGRISATIGPPLVTCSGAAVPASRPTPMTI